MSPTSPAHLVRPEWPTFLEHDPAEAERSRRKVAELAIAQDALVTGGHFGIPTLGRLRRVETGYAWELPSRRPAARLSAALPVRRRPGGRPRAFRLP